MIRIIMLKQYISLRVYQLRLILQLKMYESITANAQQ